jgi:hypothetical protein
LTNFRKDINIINTSFKECLIILEVFMNHVRMALAVLVLALIIIGCTATPAPTTVSYSIKEAHSGFVRDIDIPAKDFEIIGLVFHEAVFENGNGERLTYDALLKAAAQIGGNGIVNIMIDVKRERTTRVSSSVYSGTRTQNINYRETWYGSALAIRYTNTVAHGTPTSTGGNSISATSPTARGDASADSDWVGF